MRAPDLAKIDFRWSCTVCWDTYSRLGDRLVSAPATRWSQQLGLARRQSVGAREQVEPFGGRARLDRDGDVPLRRSAVLDPRRPERQPHPVTEVHPRARRVVVDAGLDGEQLGGDVVRPGRDRPAVALGGSRARR